LGIEVIGTLSAAGYGPIRLGIRAERKRGFRSILAIPLMKLHVVPEDPRFAAGIKENRQ
jgi:hypothetical protein